MKNNITELVFILDRSGSMAGLESDTIGGFNAMIEKQKKQEQEDLAVLSFSSQKQKQAEQQKLVEREPAKSEGGKTAPLFARRIACGNLSGFLQG